MQQSTVTKSNRIYRETKHYKMHLFNIEKTYILHLKIVWSKKHHLFHMILEQGHTHISNTGKVSYSHCKGFKECLKRCNRLQKNKYTR